MAHRRRNARAPKAQPTSLCSESDSISSPLADTTTAFQRTSPPWRSSTTCASHDEASKARTVAIRPVRETRTRAPGSSVQQWPPKRPATAMTPRWCGAGSVRESISSQAWMSRRDHGSTRINALTNPSVLAPNAPPDSDFATGASWSESKCINTAARCAGPPLPNRAVNDSHARGKRLKSVFGSTSTKMDRSMNAAACGTRRDSPTNKSDTKTSNHSGPCSVRRTASTSAAFASKTKTS
mmetsp:Transcript_19511/g.65928  ORF Transcript_19511/g.65928 Transcript_19511/m.65928 type:complete len:239 (-) Transcript_19511:159-875(-)